MDCITSLGFFPCRAELDVWLRKKDDHYEYIAVYVDDLAFAMKEPKELEKALEHDFGFSSKEQVRSNTILVWISSATQMIP